MKHIHHIIPKHMGGTDDPKNLIKLTIKEHSQAHKKLYEKYGHWEDKLAWQGLSGQLGPKEKVIEEFYKQNGKRNVKFLTKEVRKRAIDNARKTNTGRKLTPEHLAKTRTWGMKQTDYQKKTVAKKLSKEYVIKGPKGELYEIKNLRQWAKENGFDQGNLTKVAQGKLKQHKGYIVRYK
jgi:hypothetical protein